MPGKCSSSLSLLLVHAPSVSSPTHSCTLGKQLLLPLLQLAGSSASNVEQRRPHSLEAKLRTARECIKATVASVSDACRAVKTV